MVDQIKEMRYDLDHKKLSILYEENGVDIMDLYYDETLGLMQMENILRSWNGTKNVALHRIVRCYQSDSIEMDMNQWRVSVLLVDGEGNEIVISNMHEDTRNPHILRYEATKKAVHDITGEIVSAVDCRLLRDDREGKVIAVTRDGCVYAL